MDSIVLHLELLWLQVQVRILPLFHQLSNIYYYVLFTCIVVFMKFCSNSHIDYTKVMNIYISALKEEMLLIKNLCHNAYKFDFVLKIS
jgi:hypothetical protein